METHKIIINTCYGSFNISYPAIELYYKRKYNQKLYFYKRANYSEDYERCESNVAEMCFFKDQGDTLNKWDINFDYFVTTCDFERTDPVLIEVVEELGKEANGLYANLSVVTIKGNKYRIEVDDGRESIVTPDTIKWDIIKD